jgi:repressor LexA
MSKLTATQAKALEYIRSSIERSGVAPTLREICSFMGYSAVGSAQDLVSSLRKKGFIEENEKQAARTYVLTPIARRTHAMSDEPDLNTYVIPLVGTVAAGNPVTAIEEHVGTLRMSIAMLPKPHPRGDELFGLQAKGESMVGAGIMDGDWLVVKLEKDPPKDTIVVARVDGDVTVKRLTRDQEHGWYLKPENPRFANIYGGDDGFEIVGRVVALQRALS